MSSKKVTFTLNGRKVIAEKGRNLIDVAEDNGIKIPALCYDKTKDKCLGTCRVCTTRVNGRDIAACSVYVSDHIMVETDTPELRDKRKALLELLFVERNHFCPGCEKSGRCDLQHLAYEAKMLAPRFPFRYPCQQVDARPQKFMLDHNRCVLCARCIEFVHDEKEGRKIFSMSGRSEKARIDIDYELADAMSGRQVKEAAALCPVGAILEKGVGFDTPIGKRKYDDKA